MNKISTTIRKYLLEENSHRSYGFNSLPAHIREILLEEYREFFVPNFDWNSTQDKFKNNQRGFTEWIKENRIIGFDNNLDILITKLREDLIHIRRSKIADKALEYFEDLVKPTLGDEVLVGPLSKFAEIALLGSHTIRELDGAFAEAKNIINSDGSIDQLKITQSKIFIGDDISLPNFERFVQKNPEYQGVFDDWKKLFDRTIELSIKGLNAYRNSTPYDTIKEVYDYLIKYRKENKQTSKVKTFNTFIDEKLDQSEIDEFLDRISKNGIDSLSKYEIEELNNADNSDFNSHKVIIDKIKNLVSDYGGYISMSDMEAESSPLYKEMGKTIHLIERINSDDVTIIVYGGYKYESEIGEYEVVYDKLDMNILIQIKELLDNAIRYDLLQKDI